MDEYYVCGSATDGICEICDRPVCSADSENVGGDTLCDYCRISAANHERAEDSD